MIRIASSVSLAALAFTLFGCEAAPGADYATIEAAASSGPVVVNEVAPGNSGWVELYNKGPGSVDVSGYVIDDVADGGSSPKIVPAGTTLAEKGFLVLSYSGVNTASADSVRLVSPDGAELDTHPNGYAGSSVAGLCFGRSPDGGAWSATSLACTKGASNPGAAPPPATTATVVVNELKPGSSGWIELYNAGATDASLAGWSVDDVSGGGSSPKTLSAGTVVPAKGRVVVSYGGVNTASADEVRLIDAQGKAIDAHANFFAGTSISGKCFGRQPDGGAWAPASIPCTSGAPNKATAASKVLLTEFSPGKVGWVELLNTGTTAVDLSGWMLDDVANGGSAPSSLTGQGILQGGETRQVPFGTINSASADEVRLLDATGAVVDSHANYYGTDPCYGVGKCFGRVPMDGAWSPHHVMCTPGFTNPDVAGDACLPGSACNDGNTCTAVDSCNASCECIGAGEPDCDDKNACTMDGCTNSWNSTASCWHSAVADGTACGTGKSCKLGSCLPTGATPSYLVLNELKPGGDGWVELYNPTAQTIFAGPYAVSDGGGGYVGGSSDTVPPKGRTLIPASGLINTSSKESVYLNLIGENGVPAILESTSNFYTSGSTAGKCFGKQPDGGAWNLSAITCSPGASNGLPPATCTVGAACDDGDVCTAGDTFAADCTCTSGAPKTCDDNNPCTMDACGKVAGCQNTQLPEGTSCGAAKACKAGVCVGTLPGQCAGAGGTYKTVKFTQDEECHAVDWLNHARYSDMNVLNDEYRQYAYDCTPLGPCGYRSSAWTTLAEVAMKFGATSLASLKTAAAAWTQSGPTRDTVAWTWTHKESLKGLELTFDSVYVDSKLVQLGTYGKCAIVRDAPGAPNSLTVCYKDEYCYDGCNYQKPDWSALVGKYVLIRGRLYYEASFPGGARWRLYDFYSVKPGHPGIVN